VALIRSGSKDEGRKALQQYLNRRPDADDHGIISMMAAQK
jgi:hypothetical protein